VSILTSMDEYKFWHDEKLTRSITNIDECLVDIFNPDRLTSSEKDKVLQLCTVNNFALFQLQNIDSFTNDSITNISAQFGLTNSDDHLYAPKSGLSRITQSKNEEQATFIPYTSKAISWHTDGYYNPTSKRIRAFTLFCVNKAASGGSNAWIDPQIVYLLLRENNPDVARALTHSNAMTIPTHEVNGSIRRPKSTGPIFFIDKVTKKLSMRYTQRKKNILFLNSIELKQAVEYLDKLLDSDSAHHFKLLFEPGQGIICNNVIHNREQFSDDPSRPRLLLRGRYYNQTGTLQSEN